MLLMYKFCFFTALVIIWPIIWNTLPNTSVIYLFVINMFPRQEPKKKKPSPTPRSSAALLRGLPGWDKLDTMHHELRAWGSATRFSAIVPLKCKVQIYSCDRQVKCWGGKPMKASLKADYADNTKAGDCLKTCWVFSYMVSQNFPFLYKILQTFLILSKPSFPECCNC